MRKVFATLALVALFGLVVACGGSSGGGQPAGSTKVSLTEWKFDPGTDSPITVAHGKVAFWLVNTGNTAHDLSIKDGSGNTVATSELVSPGDSKEFDIDLAAGSYTILCTQEGHAQNGMKGTLTVT